VEGALTSFPLAGQAIMGRSKCCWSLTVSSFVLAIAVVSWAVRIEQSNGYPEIQLGMSLEQIEAIIGKAGNYVSVGVLDDSALRHLGTIGSPLPAGDEFGGDRFTEKTARMEEWNRECGGIRVGFSDEGRAIWKQFVKFPERSIIVMIKEWLRLD
jgi:hypothetical protein